MNVSVNGTDITNYIETISWSGDENQLARKVTISYLYAPGARKASVAAVRKGDRLVLSEGGILFDGIVVTEERTENSIRMQNTAYDYAWYLRSKALGVYKGSPGEVVSQVCAENGIPCGSIYDPGGEAEVISTGEKSISQVIRDAYEGHDVHIYMEGQRLCTERYGDVLAGTVTGDDSVTDGSYKSSIENIVNRVVLLDAHEEPAGEIENGLSRYGVIREAYKITGGEKDYIREAQKLLKGIEDSGKITVVGNPQLRTGRAVICEKAGTRIRGRFTIISDSHSIQDASYITALGLRFHEVV